MVIVAALTLILALVVLGLAVASATGILRRNRFAGVRTPATMSDDESFTVANRIAAPSEFAAAGVLVIAAGFAAFTTTLVAIAALVACVLAALVLVGFGAGLAAKAAQARANLAAEQEVGDCGHACTSCSLREACAN